MQVDIDYEKKFPNTVKIVDVWPSFKAALLKFVFTRKLGDEESLQLLSKLQQLPDGTLLLIKMFISFCKFLLNLFIFLIDKKDSVLLMLLPEALKAPMKAENSRQNFKKQKCETEEEKESKRNDRETFIIHTECTVSFE